MIITTRVLLRVKMTGKKRNKIITLTSKKKTKWYKQILQTSHNKTKTKQNMPWTDKKTSIIINSKKKLELHKSKPEPSSEAGPADDLGQGSLARNSSGSPHSCTFDHAHPPAFICSAFFLFWVELWTLIKITMGKRDGLGAKHAWQRRAEVGSRAKSDGWVSAMDSTKFLRLIYVNDLLSKSVARTIKRPTFSLLLFPLEECTCYTHTEARDLHQDTSKDWIVNWIFPVAFLFPCSWVEWVITLMRKTDWLW